MRFVLLRAINGQLGGEKPLKKAKLSYCHRQMTFEIISPDYKFPLQQSRVSAAKRDSVLFIIKAICSISVLLFLIEQLFSINFSEVEKLLCVTAHVKHFKHVPRSNH